MQASCASRLSLLSLLTLIGAAVFATPAAVRAAAPAPTERDRPLREIVGTLLYTTLNADIHEAPAREVLGGLAEALDLNLHVTYLDDEHVVGIDPETPITLKLERATGLEMLELVLEQCSVQEECTWQVRAGRLEVGPKEVLARKPAMERKIYPIGDLLSTPPGFVSPLALDPDYHLDYPDWHGPHGYAGSGRYGGYPGAYPGGYSRGVTGSVPITPRGRESDARERRDESRRELIEAIVSSIEPGEWDYGQFDELPDPSQRTALQSTMRYTLRVLNDRLIINAPPFVHRQLSGVPQPIPPRELSLEERETRSLDASSFNRLIIVTGQTESRPVVEKENPERPADAEGEAASRATTQ